MTQIKVFLDSLNEGIIGVRLKTSNVLFSIIGTNLTTLLVPQAHCKINIIAIVTSTLTIFWFTFTCSVYQQQQNRQSGKRKVCKDWVCVIYIYINRIFAIYITYISYTQSSPVYRKRVEVKCIPEKHPQNSKPWWNKWLLPTEKYIYMTAVSNLLINVIIVNKCFYFILF